MLTRRMRYIFGARAVDVERVLIVEWASKVWYIETRHVAGPLDESARLCATHCEIAAERGDLYCIASTGWIMHRASANPGLL